PEPPEPGLIGLAVADVFRAIVREGPVLVAIDDLQWLDRASDETLAFAARRIHGAQVALLVARRGTAGPDEARTPRAGGDRMAPADGLASALERSRRIELGPLSVGALGRLLHERLGGPFPRPTGVRLPE